MHNRDANEFKHEFVFEFVSESLSEFVFKADQTQIRSAQIAAGMREYLEAPTLRVVHDF